MSAPIHAMKSNMPRPIWPWIVGAAALGGGVTMYKKNVLDVHRRHAGSVLPAKTTVTVKDDNKKTGSV